MIAIVNTGGANLASVANALGRLGAVSELTSDPDRIAKSEKVILPGVGSAKDAVKRLQVNGLDQCLKGLRQPLLGICLGMQLLFEASAEGPTQCLGILPGKVERLNGGGPIPHMGWNQVCFEGNGTTLLDGISSGSYFYFAHSYRAPWGKWVRGCCEYEEKIPAVIEQENFFGVQFHPERSAQAGTQLLRNFLAL